MPKPPNPLHNVFDVHAHAHPDRTKRSIDALELARLYQERALRGMVLENHPTSTNMARHYPVALLGLE